MSYYNQCQTALVNFSESRDLLESLESIKAACEFFYMNIEEKSKNPNLTHVLNQSKNILLAKLEEHKTDMLESNVVEDYKVSFIKFCDEMRAKTQALIL